MPKSPTRPTQYPSPQWARALHRGKPRHSCREDVQDGTRRGNASTVTLGISRNTDGRDCQASARSTSPRGGLLTSEASCPINRDKLMRAPSSLWSSTGQPTGHDTIQVVLGPPLRPRCTGSTRGQMSRTMAMPRTSPARWSETRPLVRMCAACCRAVGAPRMSFIPGGGAMAHTICLLPGDGIGPEVSQAAREVH